MTLITNHHEKKHVDTIKELIPSSKKIILCSGWLDNLGIKKILPHLINASNKNADITIYSNARHTTDDAINTLSEHKHKHIKHIMIKHKKKYLHTKIYYFETEKTYTAIIGSANLTKGGLVKNEELSIKHQGKLGDEDHAKIVSYLNELAKLQ